MSLFLERALANACIAITAYLVTLNPDVLKAAKSLGLELKSDQ